MPLSGSVGERIRTLYHEERAGGKQRSRAQKIAIAFATKRREKRRRK